MKIASTRLVQLIKKKTLFVKWLLQSLKNKIEVFYDFCKHLTGILVFALVVVRRSVLRQLTRANKLLWNKAVQRYTKNLARRVGTFYSEHIVPLPIRHKVALLGMAVVIGAWVGFVAFKTGVVIGATFTFTQSSWTGGVTANTAAEPTNRSGWNQYSSASNMNASSNLILGTGTGFTLSSRHNVTTNLTRNNGVASGVAVSKIITNTSTGVMYMVYVSQEYSAGFNSIAFRTSTDGGLTWGARRDITTWASANGPGYPAIALDRVTGNLYVAYTSNEFQNGRNNIAFRTSTNGGLTWGARRDITASTTQDTNGGTDIAYDSNTGNLYVAYGGNGLSNFRTSTDGGLTWGTARNVLSPTAAGFMSFPKILIGNGTIYIGYYSTEYFGSISNIAMRTSTDNGLTWGARRDVTTNSSGGSSYYPSLAMDGAGKLYAAYQSNEVHATFFNIAVRTSTDGGITWGTRRDLTANTTFSSQGPQAAADSTGTVSVAYYSKEFNSSFNNVAMRTSTTAGASWSARRDITTSASFNNSSPTITLDSAGNQLIGYTSREYSNGVVDDLAFRSWAINNLNTRKDVTLGGTFDVHNSAAPSVVTNSTTGMVYMVYASKEYSGVYYNIALRTSTDNGVTWSTRRDLTTNTTFDSYRPKVTIDGAGTLSVAYVSGEYNNNNSFFNIAFRTSTDNGLTWGTRRNVTTNASVNTNNSPTLINGTTPGNLFIVYYSTEFNGSFSNIAMRTSTDGGLTWGTRRDVTTNTTLTSQTPTITIDNSNTLFVFYTSTEFNASFFNVAMRTSTNGGLTWGSRRDVTTGSAVSAYSPTAVSNGSSNFYLSYYSLEFNALWDNVAMRTSTDGGLTWGTRRDITTNSSVDSLQPIIQIDGNGALYATYYSNEYNGTYTNIAVRTSTNGGVTWGTRRDVTTSTFGSASYPSAYFDGLGNIHFGYVSNIYDSATPNVGHSVATIGTYYTTGNLVSSAYDTSDAANRMAEVDWDETSVPSGASVTVSLRTAATSGGLSSASWTDLTSGTTGCSKASVTVTCGLTAIPVGLRDGSNDRWFQYKVSFTGNSFTTPALSQVVVKYVINAAPELQNVTASENSDGTVTISYQTRDADTSSGTTNPGYVTPSFKYWNGTTYVSVSTLSANATTTKAVNSDGVTWTSYSATWYPKADYNNTATTTAKIQVTVDDGEAANNSVSLASANFTLDTLPPLFTSMIIDASSTPAVLTFSVVDTSTLQMKVSTDPLLVGASYVAFATNTSINLSANPSTVYAQFQDAYSNTTTIASVTTPESPTSTVVEDVSNLRDATPAYRLFLAWKTVSIPANGFGSYKVYRSTDQSTWSLLTTITDRLTNYYLDATTVANTLYYYKAVTVDTPGNVSFSSAIVNGKANGTQDAGEGGGGSAGAPTISNVTSSAITPSLATITWDTDSLSNSTVNYGTTPGSFPNSVAVSSLQNTASGIGNHSVILSNLSANTLYYFSVQSTNSTNSTTIDNNGGNGYTFTTLSSPVITAPPTVTNISNATATVAWQTNTAADSYIFYSTSTNFASAVTVSDNSYVTSHSLTFGGLTAGTKYYFYIRSRESGGNTEYDQNVVNGVINYYTLVTTNDVSGPTFSNFTVSANTSTATVIWTTNKKSDSQLDYGTTTGYGSLSSSDGTLTTRHAITLTGLSASTTYHYRARSRDVNGNLGLSSDQTFSTLGAPDTTPPVITNLATSSIALTRATVSWNTDELANGTVDFGTTGVYGSLAGSLYDFTSTTHSITLTSLQGNTTYYFRANSADPSGNTVSSTGIFVTQADVTPPDITASTTLVNDTAAFVNWTTNEQAVSEVDYGPTASFGVSVFATSSFDLNHSLALTGLSPETTYYYQIVTADPSANTTTQGPFSLTTSKYGASTQPAGSSGSASYTPPPNVAPTIVDLKVTNITPYSAVITWTTDVNGNTLVRYGLTAGYGSIAGDELAKTTDHQVTLVNLRSGVTYHIQGESFNDTSVVGASSDATFTTLNLDGTVAQPTAEPAPSSLAGQVQHASADDVAQILRALLNNPFLKDISQTEFTKIITEMSQKVVDAPSIVGLKPVVEVHGNAATIRWSTDKKTTGLVSFAKTDEYKPTTDKPYTTTVVDSSNDTISTVHQVDLANLDPGTLYHFQVASKGEIGPEARSKDYTFQTEAVLPIISNTAISNVTESSAVVSWNTNVPTESTIEYTNAKTNTTLTIGDTSFITSHSLIVHDLDSGAPYNLIIKAKNETNNETDSTVLHFTTIIDLVPPQILNLTSNSTLYPGQNSKVQTIISWDTDKPSTAQVSYQEGVGVASTTAFSSPLDSNASVKHIVVLTNLRPGTVYRYWVESTSTAGNHTRSDIFSVLTPIEKKTIIDIIGQNFQGVFGWTKNLGF